MNIVLEILMDGLLGSITSVYSIAVIIIPIMVVLQLLKDYKILDRITGLFRFLSTLFRTSLESVLPLLVGIIFGLSYGAGVIIQSAKEGNLAPRDLFLITVFLVSCHAVFEDTLIFVAVGAHGLTILGIRLLVAFLLTFLLSRRNGPKLSSGSEVPHYMQ